MPPPGRLAMGKLKEDGSTASEPFLLVDDIEQRLPGGKAAAVFDQHRLPFVAVGGAVDRNMRGDQHVRHAPQRVIGRQWLGSSTPSPPNNAPVSSRSLHCRR